jgi:hypothetical protein
MQPMDPGNFAYFNLPAGNLSIAASTSMQFGIRDAAFALPGPAVS